MAAKGSAVGVSADTQTALAEQLPSRGVSVGVYRATSHQAAEVPEAAEDPGA